MKYKISTREIEIIELISHGLSDKAIGSTLYISPHTVKSHRKNLFTKLDVHNGPGLVRRAFELGLLKLEMTA